MCFVFGRKRKGSDVPVFCCNRASVWFFIINLISILFYDTLLIFLQALVITLRIQQKNASMICHRDHTEVVEEEDAEILEEMIDVEQTTTKILCLTVKKFLV